MVGNKIDLGEKREVNTDELKEYGTKKKMDTIETSAKERINIDEAFKKIVDLILSNKSEDEILSKYGSKSSNEINLSKNNIELKKQSCCFK